MYFQSEFNRELMPLLLADKDWRYTCRLLGLTRQQIGCVAGFIEHNSPIDRHLGSHLIGCYRRMQLQAEAA